MADPSTIHEAPCARHGYSPSRRSEYSERATYPAYLTQDLSAQRRIHRRPSCSPLERKCGRQGRRTSAAQPPTDLGAERGQHSLLTSDTTTLILFAVICPARGVGAALALPYADADMMQLHLDEISRNVTEGAHAVLLLDRAGWHTTGKLVVPENITPDFPAFASAAAEPSGEHLAISAPELALKHRLRKLRRDHRCRMRRMAKAYRPTQNDHVNRNARRLGPRRSGAVTLDQSSAWNKSCPSEFERRFVVASRHRVPRGGELGGRVGG